MAVNLAAKYSSKVDERFKLMSLTESAVNKDYDWVGVQTVKVYSFPTVAMNDYARTGTNRYGVPTELQDTVQEMTLTKDRSFSFTVDKGNELQSAGARNANKALSRQIDEVVLPEIDIYRLSVMATAATTAGGTATAAITASNAYSSLLDATEYFGDNKVPQGGRIAFVKPSYYNFLKLDNSFIKASEIAQNMLIRGQVGEVDGIRIVMVPTSYLPANTEFIAAHRSVITAPEQLRELKIHTNPPGINGQLVEGRVIYDAFAQSQKTKGLYVHKNL